MKRTEKIVRTASQRETNSLMAKTDSALRMRPYNIKLPDVLAGGRSKAHEPLLPGELLKTGIF